MLQTLAPQTDSQASAAFGEAPHLLTKVKTRTRAAWRPISVEDVLVIKAETEPSFEASIGLEEPTPTLLKSPSDLAEELTVEFLLSEETRDAMVGALISQFVPEEQLGRFQPLRVAIATQFKQASDETDEDYARRVAQVAGIMRDPNTPAELREAVIQIPMVVPESFLKRLA